MFSSSYYWTRKKKRDHIKPPEKVEQGETERERSPLQQTPNGAVCKITVEYYEITVTGCPKIS